MKMVLYLGFLPKEENYREMTEEEWGEYKAQCPDETEKVYILEPEKRNMETDGLVCISETERACLRDGVRAIRQMAEGKSFEDDEALLRYVAQILPSVFSRGTKFER